jgi:hypothetical protein
MRISAGRLAKRLARFATSGAFDASAVLNRARTLGGVESTRNGDRAVRR